MQPAGFEHAVSASERLGTYALVRAAAGIGCYFPTNFKHFVTESNVGRPLGLYSEGTRLRCQQGP